MKKLGKVLGGIVAAFGVLFVLLIGWALLDDDGEAGESAAASAHLEEKEEEAEEPAGAGGSGGAAEEDGASEASGTESDDTWAIYWYLCGSDLESEYGAASLDFEEVMAAELSDRVQVIVETGGANSWENGVDPDQLERYLCSSEGVELVDTQPSANMGDAETLSDFLAFCAENYPADHTAVIFWNHGGGTLGGVAYDERYDYDSLSLNEIHEAFADVYELSEDNPPLELIGFDACLMASIDTADMASDIARYLVASEESEPGNGWSYTELLNGLSENTGMDGAKLGRLICDAFYEDCEREDVADEVTLSVIDLQKIPALAEAYNALGAEALNYAYEDPHFYTEFSRCADASENYGGNTFFSGYTDMVDLGDLVKNSSDLLPLTSENLLKKLDDCVVYKVNGSYRENASGLSCYHAYDGDTDMYLAFSECASSPAIDSFYGYSLTGILTADAADYLGDNLTYEIGEITEDTQIAEYLPGQPEADSLEDYPLELSEDGDAVLNLGSELASELSTVLIHLVYYDEEADVILDLGSDSDLYGDWETGVFTENFHGYWGSIDGYLCYREVVYEGDDYTLYAVPILLNGEACSLSVVYDYEEEEYEILGARRTTDMDSMGEKYLLRLNPGDEITTLHYASSLSGDDDFYEAEIDTFTVTEDTSFYDTDLGDGDFVLYFDMMDAQNNSYLSAPVYFTVEDGDIYVEIE